MLLFSVYMHVCLYVCVCVYIYVCICISKCMPELAYRIQCLITPHPEYDYEDEITALLRGRITVRLA